MGRGPEQDSGPRRGHRKFKTAVAGVTVLAAAAYGVSQIENPLGFLPNLGNIPKPHLNVNNNPPDVSVALRPNTYETEAKLNISCKGRISVGIDDKGTKTELMGRGDFDKVVFGDFLMCGDRDKVLASAKITTNADTGKVTQIIVETPGLEVTQPRVDHEDPRNCAETRVKDTDEKIKAKIEKMKQDKENHKKIKCDDGFDISGPVFGHGYGGPDLANVITTANTAAQIAMTLDAQPGNLIAQMNGEFLEDMRTFLEQQNPGAVVIVRQSNLVDTAKERLKKVSDELIGNLYDVSFGVKDGKVEMNVGITGGGKATVRVRSTEMQRAIIDNIQKTGEIRLTDTTANIAPDQRSQAQMTPAGK